MKRPLRTLFYGLTHEHAPGKLASLLKMRDVFEVVAIVDDSPRRSPMYRDQPWDSAGCLVVPESEAWNIPDIDVGFVETTNCDLIEIAAQFSERGIPMHCDKPCGEDFATYRRVVETCRAKNIPMQIGYMYRTNPAYGVFRGLAEVNTHPSLFDVIAPEYRSTSEGVMNFITFFIGSTAPLLFGALSDKYGVQGFEIGFAVLASVYVVGACALFASYRFCFAKFQVEERENT